MYPTIITYTGVIMNPSDPKPENIQIADIAHALSMMTRANGHLKTFYSVAQHSVNCVMEALARGYSERVQFACLLHDASEAYLSDMTRPVKEHLPEYAVLEERMQNVVWKVFGLNDLTLEEKEQVKSIDDAMLYFEFLILRNYKVFEKAPDLISEPCYKELHFTAFEDAFLAQYRRLCGECR